MKCVLCEDGFPAINILSFWGKRLYDFDVCKKCFEVHDKKETEIIKVYVKKEQKIKLKGKEN